MNRTIFLCFLAFVAVSLARNPLDRYGILYVNEITANIDTFTVQIEESFVEDNILRTDVIEEWTGGSNGVRSEGIFFNDGDVVLADDFLVNPDTTFPGELYANGGIYADAGRYADPVEDFYSFVVEDDTGRTTFGGAVYVDNGIFSNVNAFVVQAGTGETTVRNQRTNAYGGVNVSNGVFTADNWGELYIDSTLHVTETVILGTTNPEDRFIRRMPTEAQEGGATYFTAQDGESQGGDLYFIPGIDTTCAVGGDHTNCDDGQIFLGGRDNSNLRITRPPTGVDGGDTIFNGQFSPNGDGGDLVFASGDSLGDGAGGDLLVIPGIGSVGEHGRIYFGTNEDGLANFDLTIGRPTITVGNGGDTFFVGQNTQSGNAGNLNILAGQGSNGAPLYLVPGDANQASGNLEEQGDIILGNNAASELVVTRSQATSGAAGFTLFQGQNTQNDQDGGAMFFKAGSARGGGDGGNIHLLPGSNPSSPGSFGVNAGDIILGDQVTDLTITREPRNGGGRDTFIRGQDGAATQGGDLFFYGGNGVTLGGDVSITGGDQDSDSILSYRVGGGVILQGGNGQLDGGNVIIRGGDTTAGNNDGDITITTSGDLAGDIVFNGGNGATLGDVAVGDNSNEFIIDTTPVVIDGSYLEIQSGDNSVIYRADTMNILEVNDVTLLRAMSDYPVPAVPTETIDPAADPLLTRTTYRLAQLQNSLEILVNALGHCQIGLFATVDPGTGLPDSCEAFA